jgi:hypothetical protein
MNDNILIFLGIYMVRITWIANPFNIPLERRIQTISTFFTVLTPFMLIALNIVCIINPLLWLPYLAYLTWIFYLDVRVPVHQRAKRMSVRVRSMPHLLKFREYFPSQLVKTAELDPKKPHMLCIHPHGTFYALVMIIYNMCIRNYWHECLG